MTNRPRPFTDLRSTGLLWLINTTIFHPRGYALAIHLDGDGVAVGWSLMGDGSEAWYFDPDPAKWPEGEGIDDTMQAAKKLLP